MRVLIVASHNKQRFAPFIVEQAEAVKNKGIIVDYFGITANGIRGYLHTLPALKKKNKDFKPDIIHAHYGLSGLLANLQRQVPVVTTYHGSDINIKSILRFSRISILLSRFNIFVSQKTIDIAKPRNNYALIPCGIDLSDLQLTNKNNAREIIKLDPRKKYILFAGAFDNAVKNYPLAKETMALIPDAELIELKGYSRNEVTYLMCAVDAFLMTSHSEGSPQVIKEAMACGCPIVSVDVGDVCELLDGIDGCYVCNRDATALANCLCTAMKQHRTKGRDRIIEKELDNRHVTEKLLAIYEKVI